MPNKSIYIKNIFLLHIPNVRSSRKDKVTKVPETIRRIYFKKNFQCIEMG